MRTLLLEKNTSNRAIVSPSSKKTFALCQNELRESNVLLHKESNIRLFIDNNEYIDFVWGEHYMIGTPAYWVDQAKLFPPRLKLREGNSLSDEVVFCLLGGHGITFEMNSAAYQALKAEGLLCSEVASEEQIAALLRKPLTMPGKPKPARYRFPFLKAKRIHQALIMLRSCEPPEHPLSLREWLMKLPGIGFKTASWIVRNYLNSDAIAIIDIHIQRAGVAAGFFKRTWKLPNDYSFFERAFLEYASIGGIAASVLDVCIWEQMRSFGRHANELLPK